MDWTNVRGLDDGDCCSCRRLRSCRGRIESEQAPPPGAPAQVDPPLTAPARHNDVLLHDGPLLLTPDDPRSHKVGRVTTRIVEALEQQDCKVVSGAAWPPREDKKRNTQEDDSRIARYGPSATATSGFMPYRPISNNPLKDKNIQEADLWNIYVIDLVSHHGKNCVTGTVS